METLCKSKEMEFSPLNKKKVIAKFDGDLITSDAGLILIKQLDEKLNITERLANCFIDCRDQDRIRHTVLELLRQRIYGICAGYADLNDHDRLRKDPLFSILTSKDDLDQQAASKSTLNRMELCPEDIESILHGRYHKIAAMPAEIESLFLDVFLDITKKPQTLLF